MLPHVTCLLVLEYKAKTDITMYFHRCLSCLRVVWLGRSNHVKYKEEEQQHHKESCPYVQKCDMINVTTKERLFLCSEMLAS